MMTADDLRTSILLLAFSGKLTQQMQEDGDSKTLLNYIDQEKKETSPSKKQIPHIFKDGDNFFIKEKKNTVCITEQLPYEIPENWTWVHLNEVAESRLGKTLNKTTDVGTEKQYLCSINVYWNGVSLVQVKTAMFSDEDQEKYLLRRGDLLICEGGDAGRSAIWEADSEMYYQNALHCVRFYGDIDPYYFLWLMRFYKLNGTTTKHCKGVTIKHLVQKSLNSIYFPLPPLAEQKRIVAKIEELMPYVEQYDAASKKLDALNASFPEQLKKSILQQAVEGKLVPQDPSDEPASVLLKKIDAEKQRLVKEGKIKKQKKLPEITEDEIPFDIPDSWEWVRFGELGDYKKGPFGSALTKSMFVPKSEDTIKVYEQKNAIQKNSKLGDYYITKAYFEDAMEGFEVLPGDVIVSCAGTIGETYILPENIERGIINQALMRMRIFSPMDINYFLLFFSALIKGAAQRQGSGSAIKNIPPFRILKNYLVAIPPLAEQKRIVAMIEELMPYCEMI